MNGYDLLKLEATSIVEFVSRMLNEIARMLLARNHMMILSKIIEALRLIRMNGFI